MVELHTGSFLIADPELKDPNFDGAVVLLCTHEESGTFGLVLNRGTTVTLADALPDANDFGGGTLPVAWGGPVGLDRLHVLHGGPATTPDSQAVIPGVRYGAAAPALGDLHSTNTPLRFFIGYAGWDDGQLEAEVEAGAWRLIDADATHVFAPDSAGLWGRMLADIDPEFDWMRHLPPDPWTE